MYRLVKRSQYRVRFSSSSFIFALIAEIDVGSSLLSAIHLSNGKRNGNTLCNVGLLR